MNLNEIKTEYDLAKAYLEAQDIDMADDDIHVDFVGDTLVIKRWYEETREWRQEHYLTIWQVMAWAISELAKPAPKTTKPTTAQKTTVKKS